MINTFPVIEQILMLLCITASGFYMRRKGVMTDPVIKGVNTLLLSLAWPCMILMTTQKECTAETLTNFLTILIFTFAVLAIFAVTAFMLLRKKNVEMRASVFSVLAIMPNAGFVGLPIIRAVYGDLGVFYLSAFLVGFNLVTWTVCVFFFTGMNAKSLRAALNPGFIAAIVGSLLFLLHIQLPGPLLSTVNQLGSLTTPLSMLLLGARLDRISAETLKSKWLWASVLLKLVAMPLFAFGIMKAIHISPDIIGIVVLCMAMPAASVAQLFAEKYNGDIKLATAGVSIGMLLCIITIPFVLLLI